jgi:hypothetical protein
MSSQHRHAFVALLAASLIAGTAGAQLLPSLPGVGGLGQPARGVPVLGPLLEQVLPPAERRQVIAPTLDRLGPPEAVARLDATSLLELRRLRLRELVSTHVRELEMDGAGQPVRRGILVAVSPSPEALAAAQRAGFRVVAEEGGEALGLQLVTLAVPARLSAREALARLRRAAPGIEADFDHLYEPAGGALAPVGASLAVATGGAAGAAGRTIAMIDGGVASHPSLAGAAIEQRAFAGPAKATGHGTAVASLLVGRQGPFRGAATGARLYVADVYGGSRAAGSAVSIVRALGWAASKRPDVVSISLVGPGNRLLQRAVEILHSRGIRMVAAVGNDGPAAPVQYPAGYPQVIAVTAVDARDRAVPEAGRAARLDYAAPGADMAAALPGSGYARVRGTSFATPLVAARLASTGNPALLAREAVPGKGKVGRGILCRPCRIEPKVVGAK